MTLGFFQRLGQRLQRKPLATALGISLAVHLSMLWDGEFELPDFSPDSPDELLSKKKADSIPRVKLNITPPARPKPQVGAAIVTLIEEAPAAAATLAPAKPDKPKKTLAQKKPKAQKPIEPASGDDFAPPSTHTPDKPKIDNASQQVAHDDPAIPLGDSLPPPPDEVAKQPAPPVEEPPPSFPVEIFAKLKVSFMGFGGELQQTWRMEGERYIIENKAAKFGVKVLTTSEGRVSNSGISPEHYRMYVNNKLRSFADIDRNTNTIRYGKNNDVKYTTIQNEIQDAASLPFQMAVSFTGEDTRPLQVTTGNSVYLIELKLVAEERLRLPAGELRTLHLQGQRLNTATGQTQQGYDVWLAPDYRNYPVKFRGPTSKGDIMEYSLKSLAFEGQTILGKNIKPELEHDDPEALPPELLEHPEVKENYKPLEGMPGEDAP